MTVLPGFTLTELLLPKIEFWKKIPLYLGLSVVTSSYFSYFSALIFGFNRQTLLVCFLFFAALFIYVLCLKKKRIGDGLKENWQAILTGLLVYAAFFLALYPAIFRLHNSYFVMGGPNWQDTAMHLSIIESLTQGNFPPQAPYFSGQPLSYYYFSDLHAAVVNTFFGRFFPEVLVLINPFLAMTFFFSVFALSYEITRKKSFSIVAGIGAVFYGNLNFINLFKTLLAGGQNYITLVTSNSFNFDKTYFQMTPMSDYFLQNRPMMAGLPIFILVALLLLRIKDDRGSLVRVFVAGVLSASLIKFQLFGFIVSWIFFVIYLTCQLIFRKIEARKVLVYAFVFGLSSLVLSLIFAFSKAGGRSLIQITADSFSWGAWQKHDPIWFVYFLLGNLGLGFLIYIFGFFLTKGWKKAEILAIYLTSFIVIAIPLAMKFTIYEFDMLKFFYYLIPLICVSLAYFYAGSKYTALSLTIFILITVVSSLTSANLLVHSYLNKTEGYSYPDYEVGLWIRDNTPPKSIFITMPTVHSPPTDIGGRLRIISYINWPYSHGFNTGRTMFFPELPMLPRFIKLEI